MSNGIKEFYYYYNFFRSLVCVCDDVLTSQGLYHLFNIDSSLIVVALVIKVFPQCLWLFPL